MHRYGKVGRNSTQDLEHFTMGLGESAAAPGHDDVGCALGPVDLVPWTTVLTAPLEVADELGRHAAAEDGAGKTHAGTGIEQGSDGCLGMVPHQQPDESAPCRHGPRPQVDPYLSIIVLQIAAGRHRAQIDPGSQHRMSDEPIVLFVGKIPERAFADFS